MSCLRQSNTGQLMPSIRLWPTDPPTLARLGPTLSVQVGFDPSYRDARGVTPILPPDLYPALVDTGAMESCIDASMATTLNLPIVDRHWITGVGGPLQVNLHAAQVYIPDLNWVIYGQFAGVHLSAGGQVHLALIGRSFLRTCKLVYDGRTGDVTLDND